MVQRLVLIDDLEGSEGAETIRYNLDDQEYEIDLSEEHAEELRGAFKRYIDKSRKVERQPVRPLPQRGRRRSTKGEGRTDIPQIRAWAAAHGYQVGDRGRIKKETIDAYQAHS